MLAHVIKLSVKCIRKIIIVRQVFKNLPKSSRRNRMQKRIGLEVGSGERSEIVVDAMMVSVNCQLDQTCQTRKS